MRVPLFEAAESGQLSRSQYTPRQTAGTEARMDFSGEMAQARAEGDFRNTILDGVSNLFFRVREARNNNKLYQAQRAARESFGQLQETLASTAYDNWEDIIEQRRESLYETSAAFADTPVARRNFDRWYTNEFENMRTRYAVQAARAQAQEAQVVRTNLFEEAVQNGNVGDMSLLSEAQSLPPEHEFWSSAIGVAYSGVLDGLYSRTEFQQMVMTARNRGPVNAANAELYATLYSGGPDAAREALDAMRQRAENGEGPLNRVQFQEVEQQFNRRETEFRRIEHQRIGRELEVMNNDLTEKAFGEDFTLTYQDIDPLLNYEDDRATNLYQQYSRLIEAVNEASDENGAIRVAGNDLEDYRTQLTERVYRLANEGATRKELEEVVRELGTETLINPETGDTELVFSPQQLNELRGDLEDIVENASPHYERIHKPVLNGLQELLENGDITPNRRASLESTYWYSITAQTRGAESRARREEIMREVSGNFIEYITEEKIGGINLDNLEFTPSRALRNNLQFRRKASRLLRLAHEGELQGVTRIGDIAEEIEGLREIATHFLEIENPSLRNVSQSMIDLDGVPRFRINADSDSFPNITPDMLRDFGFVHRDQYMMDIAYRPNERGDRWEPVVWSERAQQWFSLRDNPRLQQALGFVDETEQPSNTTETSENLQGFSGASETLPGADQTQPLEDNEPDYMRSMPGSMTGGL